MKKFILFLFLALASNYTVDAQTVKKTVKKKPTSSKLTQTNIPKSYNTVVGYSFNTEPANLCLDLDSMAVGAIRKTQDIIKKDSFVYIVTYDNISSNLVEKTDMFTKNTIFATMTVEKISESKYEEIKKQKIEALDSEIERQNKIMQARIKQREALKNDN